MRAPILLFASFVLLACGQGRNPSHGTTVRGPEVVLSAERDAGAPDASTPETSSLAEENPPEPRWADDCPAAAAAPEPSWKSIRFELVPRQAEDDDTSPVPREVQVAGEDEEVFPAVNHEGTIMVERFSDTESFSGHDHDSVGFFSVATGKSLGFYMLSSDLRESSPSADAIAKERKRLKRDMDAAHRILDKSTWKRVSSGRKPDGPCPGTPFTKLDQERDARDGFRWPRVTRFDREGLDFEVQPSQDEDGVKVEEKVIVRALQADGTIHTVALPHNLVPPGRTTWMADKSGTCGWSEGFYGFGSRELGVFFVYGDKNFGGDSCGAELAGKRTSVIRLPPELRTAR
ncbi:hypothetical protein [Polyangium mundeleinium]|uniref:Secreted protein n=1 Tax=Polyangium mundeleinium TaxID=2995306 RepID=A0ABT5EMM0_9BACT|nr:hypothetical protein [Polyangium mundeleinium]MDC0743078.1 hypothetical protein [Polyangium mundeleinium]